MKRFFLTTFVFFLLFGLVFPGSAASVDGEQILLSEMTGEECVQFLLSKGVEIPDIFADEAAMYRAVVDLIRIIEQNPQVRFNFGSPINQTFCDAVKNAVNTHYGVSSSRTNALTRETSALIDSTPLTGWRDSYLEYNCYSYAVGVTTTWYNLGGIYAQYHPDEPELDVIIENGAASWTPVICSDLRSMFPCVYSTTVRPVSSGLNSNQTAICVRWGYVDNAPDLQDFHFMKLSGSSWYHKPGPAIPMRYHHMPETQAWTNECVTEDGPKAGDIVYTGPIIYFVYAPAHNTINKYIGEDYHSGARHYYKFADVCQECGDYWNVQWVSQPCSGPPCSIPYSRIYGVA